MRKIDLLHQLQEIDSQADAIRPQIASLEHDIGNRQALDARAREIEVTRAEVRAIEAQQRDLELQAEAHRAKIAADEGKLYGGRVSNPKELASLADEVAQDKHQLSTVEDKLLAILDQLDEVASRLAASERSAAREQQEWEASQAQMRLRLGTARESIAALDSRRATAAAAVDPASRSTYETLRRQKGGLAIATVRQRTCLGCRVTLTASQEQRARIGNELITCHSCGRIHFVPLG